MARRIADVVTALDVAVGPDPTDIRSLPRPEASWPAALEGAMAPAKVAWSPTLGYAPLDDEVRALCEVAVERLESLGTEVVEIEVVFDEDPVRDWLTLAVAYNLRTLAPVPGHRGVGTGRPAPGRAGGLGGGASVGPRHRAGPGRLPHVEPPPGGAVPRRPAAADADLRGPPPPRALEGQGLINGEPEPNWARFTYPFNMTRSPAASVCAGLTTDGLPVGIQLVGPQHADLVVIRSAAALEAAIGFDDVAPL